MMQFIILTILIVCYYFDCFAFFEKQKAKYILILLPIIAYITIFFLSEECVILLFILVIMVFNSIKVKKSESFIDKVKKDDVVPFKEDECKKSVFDESNYRHVLIRHRFETEEEQDPYYFDTQGMAFEIKGF